MNDCIYYGKDAAGDPSCKGLVSCDCDNCSFYKNAKMEEKSRSAWAEKLNSLPEHAQNYYSVKYYGGKEPWKGMFV